VSSLRMSAAEYEEVRGRRTMSSEDRARVAATWKSGDSLARQTYGYVDPSSLTIGFVRALAQAVRRGVPVNVLAGRVVVSEAKGVSVDPLEAERRELERKLATVRGEIDRLARSLKSASNERTVARVTADMDQSATQEERLEARLGRVVEALRGTAAAGESASPAVALPPVVLFAHVLVAALRRLVESAGSLSAEEAAALRTLIPVFEVDPVAHKAVAVVRLIARPSKPGEQARVAEVGPFAWTLERVGVTSGTYIHADESEVIEIPSTSRAALKSVLESAGLTSDAAATALNGPMSLPLVLAHRLAGTPLPQTVDGRWLDDDWVDHLVRIYADPAYVHLGHGRYTQAFPLGQAVLYYAERHETFTAAEARDALLAGQTSQIHSFAAAAAQRSGQLRPTPQLLVHRDVVRRRASELTRLSGVRCVCGSVAAVWCPRPEVPRGLLCECGRMPDARQFGLSEDFLFPPSYAVRVSEAECLTVLEGQFEERKSRLNPKLAAMLTMLRACPEPLTAASMSAELGARAGTPSVRVTVDLDKLLLFGLVEKLPQPRTPGSRGSNPALWRLTPDGVSRAAQL
jgi:hypothetical protein